MNPRHHLTVDVEEFFHSTALTRRVPPGRWDGLARRAPRMVDWILERLAEREATATFFVLGWSAEKDPRMVRVIAEAGHEVASHGWEHLKVHELGPERFRTSIRRTRRFLEDLTGHPVLGYRAPSFSITRSMGWALDVLVEEGYRYDSSIFPVGIHPGYGDASAPAAPWEIRRPAGVLREVPPATVSMAGQRLPAAGGAYLRFFPVALVRTALREAERAGHAGTLFIHPWDLDPEIEPMPLPLHLRLRLFGGARMARRRLTTLLSEFRFEAVREGLTPL